MFAGVCGAALFFFFFFNDTATTEIYTLSLHDALPIYVLVVPPEAVQRDGSETFVWVRDQRGKAEQQPVELGLQGLDLFAVTEGLSQGDEIALVPPTVTITSGMPLAAELPVPDATDAE